MYRITLGLLAIACSVVMARADDDEAAKKALKLLQGEYELVQLNIAGKDSTPKSPKDTRAFKIKDDQLIAVLGDSGKEDPVTIRLNLKEQPAQVDLLMGKTVFGLGVYQFEKNMLTICIHVNEPKADDRPKVLNKTGKDYMLMVLKKIVEEKK